MLTYYIIYKKIDFTSFAQAILISEFSNKVSSLIPENYGLYKRFL